MSNRKIITDQLVIKETGKPLEYWFLALDEAGAKSQSPTEIYQTAMKIPGLRKLSEWNIGLLSTAYQWSRGLRQRGEKKDGFEISCSKTLPVPLPILFATFSDVAVQQTIFGQGLTITTQTQNKSIRASWHDGTRVSIDFYAKGNDRSQIVVQHLKLPNIEIAELMKQFWQEKLTQFSAKITR